MCWEKVNHIYPPELSLTTNTSPLDGWDILKMNIDWRIKYVWGRTCQSHAVPISGHPERLLTNQILDTGKIPLLIRLLYMVCWAVRTEHTIPNTHVLLTTPFVKVWHRCSLLGCR